MMNRGGVLQDRARHSLEELRRQDPLWMLLIFCQSLVLGLSSFFLTYTIVGRGVPALAVAIFLMLALTLYWAWVARSRD